jgi:phospholipid-translocating ATPase
MLSTQEYDNWNKAYTRSSAALEKRKEMMQSAEEELQRNMELLGVTGVEDKLQEDVVQTIERLKQAGISVWMLTGDKVETAKCISISSGLKSRAEKFIVLDLPDSPTKEEVESKLNQISASIDNSVLVIDGKLLDITTKECETQFFEMAAKAKGVVCCRCSPTQKAYIVIKMKAITKKVCGAIGDGGNDVSMITEANCGIGIVGKEGKQASLAADFAIDKFSSLNKLILWHGRLSYKRTGALTQFITHRGLIIAYMQFTFSLMFNGCAVSLFNGVLTMGYTTFYTFLPVFCYIMDSDITPEISCEHPKLYETLQKGKEFSLKSFFIWVIISIYQGSLILMLSVWVFHSASTNIVTNAFTCLILCEYLNILTTLHKVQALSIVCLVLNFGVYVLSIVLMRQYLNMASLTLTFVLTMILITMIVWLPVQVIFWIVDCLAPDDYKKIMKSIKKGR